MSRKPREKKHPVNEEMKNDLLGVLFGADNFTVDIANKILAKDWVYNLEKYFEKQVVDVEPAKTPKNLKYKAMYEKLSFNIDKLYSVNQGLKMSEIIQTTPPTEQE